jgi:hypothetical protein
MTSAPKSENTVVAAGLAIKLARSTTFSPENFARAHKISNYSICSSACVAKLVTMFWICSGFRILLRTPAHHTRLDCPAQYFSRKTRFRILPDPDLGSSSVMNSIWRGTLYEAIRVLQYCLSSSADTLVPGRRTTAAATSSPHWRFSFARSTETERIGSAILSCEST